MMKQTTLPLIGKTTFMLDIISQQFAREVKSRGGDAIE